MPTQTTTLADFLLARIAEDEAAARVFAPDLARWPDANGRWRVTERNSGWQVRSEGNEAICRGSWAAMNFVAVHDPARVLAECEANRRIVELHTTVDDSNRWMTSPPRCHLCQSYGGSWPCKTLTLLALPYVDHPEFREEWRA